MYLFSCRVKLTNEGLIKYCETFVRVLFFYGSCFIVSGCRTKFLQEEINDDDDNEDEEEGEKEEEEMNETEQQKTKSINKNERPKEALERSHENAKESSVDADPRNALETIETNLLKL